MSTTLTTLDSRGIIEDPDQKIERILSYLIITEASQSNAHRRQLVSIPDILMKCGTNQVAIKNAMEAALESAFEGYFTNVLLDLSVTTGIKDPTKLVVVIRAKVEQDGKWHDVAKALTVSNDVVKLVSEFDIK